TALAGTSEMEQGARSLLTKGPRSLGPFLIPSVMPNSLSCLVSIETGIRGPVMTSTAACASGNYALLEAYHFLQRGETDIMLAGASESLPGPVLLAAFERMGALSHRDGAPEEASRPFDADRDGFVCGEGAAVLVLETEEHARQRGARIYAELLGGRLTADAYHITAPDPSGNGAVRAMHGALLSAGLAPEDVDVIFAHGTSTRLNDATETRAIKSVFGEHARRLAITATKSMVGHALGAAGAIASLAALLTLYHGLIPPTINYHTPDPECDLDYVPNVARRQPVQVAMVNAFGFGGQNVAVILRRHEQGGGAG
ncbi:MAG TPA: beta-ketoacyl-[acyl-carrier-protein] synthase family protein, partial [Anaerolineae bacterium]|nr:beta-ketoacyl-[acyl-carrier-protein] synthase family protein [Anaerolineae bacterium]